MAAAVYVFAAFVIWNLMCFSGTIGVQLQCPTYCNCLGNLVDCSRQGLINVPKDLIFPVWTTRLELQNNGISSLSKDDFKGLRNLTQLDISSNDLHFLNDSVFEHLTSLEILKINHNKLNEVPKLKGLGKLKVLELNHNHIGTLVPEFMIHMVQLTSLELNHNSLTDIIPGVFPANNSLQKLVLNNNYLESFESNCFDNLTSLEVLKINKNKVTTISRDIFKKLTNLQTLEMTKNKLKRIGGLTFQDLKNLKTLKLRKNMITTISDGAFYGLDKLVTLQLEHNNMTRVTQSWLYGLKGLREINLAHNKIKTIDPEAWQGCVSIDTIDLSNNRLVTISGLAFSKLSHLKKLFLNSNMITNIQDGAFQHLQELEELELNNNDLSWTIEDKSGVFVGLEMLMKLKLENNKIKSIANDAFKGLTNLRVLSLNMNNITSIKNNALESMALLQQLYMNSSSFLCDCQLQWLPTWLIQKTFHTMVTAKCAYPPKLTGKNIFLVQSDEFKCDGDFLKPYIMSHPKTRVALKNDNITLTCQAVSTEDSGTVFIWKRDNVVLTEGMDNTKEAGVLGDGRSIYNFTSHLNLRNIQERDVGNFQCVITNKFGSAYSNKANITIHEYPEFIKTPINVTVKVGTTARFDCSAKGEPKPKIVWRKNGGTFLAANENRFHVMTADDVFFIAQVKPEDEGVYRCTASNSEGQISINVTLSVQQPPSFTEPMRRTKIVNEGQTAVLECMAEGRPKPVLTWKKDNRTLDLTNRHFLAAQKQLLIIVKTTTTDSGKYTCEMQNTLGSRSGNTHLHVQSLHHPVKTNNQRPSSEDSSIDESTTTGIIIIAVVCCVVGTSLVWVIIIYHTRKRHELYTPTSTDDSPIPADYMSQQQYEEEGGVYPHQVMMYHPGTYQYQEYQSKESGYESSSGRIRNARAAAIFPSDVEDGNQHSGSRGLVDHSPDNSASYPNSETDSLKSSQSTSSTHTSGQQTLRTFHPDIREVPQPPPLPPSTRTPNKCSEPSYCENCELCRGDQSDSHQCQSLNRHSLLNGTFSNGLSHSGVHHGSLPQPPGGSIREVGVSERMCDSPPQQSCTCSTCHNHVSPVYNSSLRTSNACSYHHSPQSTSHNASNGPCYLNTHEIRICANPCCAPPGENREHRSDNQEGRPLHRFRSAENCMVGDYYHRADPRGHNSLNRNWSTDKIPPTIPPKQHKHMYIHANKCSLAQNGGPHGKYPHPQNV
ncbi:leucine-rich repeats and immunoglobulin-like domains protein 3 [Saccostrea cucullata]|uniref:leucine-rich repeats and immunoglobulin-like domains protein 3 n=1 Tax=Saccostrea cuccullata TaxID=36930 RepID=UPI002ED5138D